MIVRHGSNTIHCGELEETTDALSIYTSETSFSNLIMLLAMRVVFEPAMGGNASF
jgi:hypothetical protein